MLSLCRLGLGLFLCCVQINASAAALRPYVVDVQIKQPVVKEGNYYIDLLTMILNASKAPDEVIEFRYYEDQISQARWIAAVEKDKGNSVMWTMTNKEREKDLHAVRVPLYKGLMGYRLLIIRNTDEQKFAKVKTKEDLKALVAGQGTHWPDSTILRWNKFQLIEAMTKENLYKMLAAKRFDFFPRGAIEIITENDLIREHNLLVEPHLVLYYKTDLYYFVNKKNTELANRLEKGWEIILQNGEFDKLFYSTERVKFAMELIKQPGRIIIELENPLLPGDTPLQAPGYWLDHSNFR